MEYTQNYALRKPGLNEYANVGDLNFNADKIDSQMKKNQDVDGEVYDPTTTSSNAYEAGDYVINPDDGLMYVCNGTTYGTWDATKWDHTTEFEELQKAMASGGESELADLHDVEITTPTDGQALLYDDTTDKWHNSDLPDADVTKTASGNPVEFSDGADAPLVKCTTTIQGWQEGTGTPSPQNVRLLHAYTGSTISGGNKTLGGVNVMRPGVQKREVVNGLTFTSDGKGRYSIKGTATANTTLSVDCDEYIIPDGSTPYSFGLMNNNGVQAEFHFYYNNTNITYWNLTPANRVVSYAQMSNQRCNKYIIEIKSGAVIDVEFSPMICAGNTSAFPSTFNTCYVYNDHTATFSQSIYQGNADFVGSKARATWGYIASYNGETLPGEWISSMDEYAPGTTPTTGAQVAYELASPTEETITPTNLPIKSLFGYNHIESSTGEMEIEYFPAKEQPLIDLIPEASNMHTYSTEEQVVGTWIDGETIYEKTYNYTGTGAANPFTTTIDMTGKNLIEVIPHYARYTYNSGQSYGECIGAELIYSNCNTLNVRYVDSVPYTLTVSSFLGNATESYDIAFTLRYTKTSSNNRSLAKSAPQEETKEEQVEELKEEPTEEIKEETEEVKEEPVEEVKEEETKEPEDPEIKETNEEEAKR